MHTPGHPLGKFHEFLSAASIKARGAERPCSVFTPGCQQCPPRSEVGRHQVSSASCPVIFSSLERKAKCRVPALAQLPVTRACQLPLLAAVTGQDTRALMPLSLGLPPCPCWGRGHSATGSFSFFPGSPRDFSN